MSDKMKELEAENHKLSMALCYQLRATKAMRDAGDDLARYIRCQEADIHPDKLAIIKKWKAVRLPTEEERDEPYKK
jgi:hypothetical protein